MFVYLSSSFFLFFVRGLPGVQIMNFFFSFILIFEVCLRIADSERFIDWIGHNLDRTFRLLIMFIICLNGTYFFTRLTHQIITSQI